MASCLFTTHPPPNLLLHVLFSFFNFYLLIFRDRGREGEREGERNISLFCHLLMNSLVDFCVRPDREWTHNLGVLERCSDQLSYLARASSTFLLQNSATSPVSKEIHAHQTLWILPSFLPFGELTDNLCGRERTEQGEHMADRCLPTIHGSSPLSPSFSSFPLLSQPSPLDVPRVIPLTPRFVGDLILNIGA